MLRHATGYALDNEGMDTQLIQDFLRHASIANTMRYTELAPERLAAVRAR
jgi:type 1 fimbriae regulatory protein FimB